MRPARLALAALPLLLACLAAAAPAQRAAPGHGLWIGPIPVCAGTVTRVAIETDEFSDDWLRAIVTFRPAWRAVLRRESTRLVGRRIAVRLDGRIVMAPTVREPITGGEVSIDRVTARQGERIRAAARRPCPRGRR